MKFVNKKSSTITNTDVSWPRTAARRPMKANFALYNAVSHRRVLSAEPTGRMRTAMPRRHTRLGYLITSLSAKSVPAGQSSVTYETTAFVIRHRSVGLVKDSVAGTFWERFHMGDYSRIVNGIFSRYLTRIIVILDKLYDFLYIFLTALETRARIRENEDLSQEPYWVEHC